MKKSFLVLALIVLGTGIFAISETYAEIVSIVKSPTESELVLIEEGYEVHQYAVLPFGGKHFFHKTNSPLSLAEINTGRCMMYATYLVKEGESVNVTMKFPNDLIWPGMYDGSTFFLTKGGHSAHTDEYGNTVTKNTDVIWENITPVVDSEFITINFEIQDEMASLMVNSTALPILPNENSIQMDCSPVIPKIEYDYYDTVFPIDVQRIFAANIGFPPDTFICENNLIGAIKATDDTEACVKPESKVKLVERGWAKDFSE